MLKYLILGRLVLCFITGYRHGLPNAIQWTVLNAVVIGLLYGLFVLIRKSTRKGRATQD
jgi:hypothetical protein